MSSQRQAVVAGGAHSRGATPPPASPPPTHAARHGEVPPPFNLLITSAVLGGVFVAVCAVCYCCGKTKRTRKPRARAHVQRIYSVPIECPHSSSLYDSDTYSSCRRPPTPGPPPAYDSVVSSSDKLRRFGIEDDYNEDRDRFERYLVGAGSLGADELREIVITCASPRRRCEILNFMKNGGRMATTTADCGVARGVESETNRSEASLDDTTLDGVLLNVDIQSTCEETGQSQCSIKGILKNQSATNENKLIDENLPSYEVAISKEIKL